MNFNQRATTLQAPCWAVSPQSSAWKKYKRPRTKTFGAQSFPSCVPQTDSPNHQTGELLKTDWFPKYPKIEYPKCIKLLHAHELRRFRPPRHHRFRASRSTSLVGEAQLLGVWNTHFSVNPKVSCWSVKVGYGVPGIYFEDPFYRFATDFGLVFPTHRKLFGGQKLWSHGKLSKNVVTLWPTKSTSKILLSFLEKHQPISLQSGTLRPNMLSHIVRHCQTFVSIWYRYHSKTWNARPCNTLTYEVYSTVSTDLAMFHFQRKCLQ